MPLFSEAAMQHPDFVARVVGYILGALLFFFAIILPILMMRFETQADVEKQERSGY